jgi:hypothetical protein
MKKLRFYKIPIYYSENCLGTGPATPNSSSQRCKSKNAQKEQHEKKRHQVKLLHVKTHKKKMQLLMIKIQKKKMVAAYGYPWQYQACDRKDKIYPVAFCAVRYPAFQILFGTFFRTIAGSFFLHFVSFA